MPGPVERIGIIFVHGIGEQRRFSHLDAEARPLLDAVLRRPGSPQATVEIVQAAASTLNADQDTWSTRPGAPVRVLVKEEGVEKEILLHEVWWADVNEPYSFAKQLRFWAWGLAVWYLPSRQETKLPMVMTNPEFPEGSSKGGWFKPRLQLFIVSNLFLMGAFSVGALVVLARRLLNLEAPNFIRVFVNYVSSVKLYNQATRSDGGFLDAFREPPRVSIRRRMIRTMIDVALERYDRWYIFAHSLGSVVAFNGVMENAHALPNYLDEERWTKLKQADLAGRAGEHEVGPTGDMMPARPLWLHADDVVYRDRLFQAFRGLLTYGAPLDKFAHIWSAQVPINTGEPVFSPGMEWINVYDPTDPVAASLEAYGDPGTSGPYGLLAPTNYGYCAYPVLLLSHLHYLTVNTKYPNQLSDCAVEWVLKGEPFQTLGSQHQKPWFRPDSQVHKERTRRRFIMYCVAYAVLTGLALVTLPFIFRAVGGILRAPHAVMRYLFGREFAIPEVVARPFEALGTAAQHLYDWVGPVILLPISVAVTVLIFGVFAHFVVLYRTPPKHLVQPPERARADDAAPGAA